MENRDEHLWRIAKKRAGFKRHLAFYLIVNLFLWVVWFMTMKDADMMNEYGIPWPAWCSAGWGIGLAFHYYGAYHDDRQSRTMKEFQKLKDREGRM